MAEEEKCFALDGFCKVKEGVSDALTGAAGDALDQIADGVTAAVVDTIASLGSMWTRIGSANLTSNSAPASRAPARGEFNAYIDLLLSYASWIGLGVCVFGVLFLGIVLATNARRGDGAGLVNTATVLASGAALIGGATSLIGFLGSSPREWCSDPSYGDQAVRAVRGSGLTSLPVSATVVSRHRVRTSRPR